MLHTRHLTRFFFTLFLLLIVATHLGISKQSTLTTVTHLVSGKSISGLSGAEIHRPTIAFGEPQFVYLNNDNDKENSLLREFWSDSYEIMYVTASYQSAIRL